MEVHVQDTVQKMKLRLGDAEVDVPVVCSDSVPVGEVVTVPSSGEVVSVVNCCADDCEDWEWCSQK